MEQILTILDVLGKLAVNNPGQAVLGIIAVLAVARLALRAFQRYAKGTPTKADDKVAEIASEALDEAEEKAKSFADRVFKK